MHSKENFIKLSTEIRLNFFLVSENENRCNRTFTCGNFEFERKIRLFFELFSTRIIGEKNFLFRVVIRQCIGLLISISWFFEEFFAFLFEFWSFQVRKMRKSALFLSNYIVKLKYGVGHIWRVFFRIWSRGFGPFL